MTPAMREAVIQNEVKQCAFPGCPKGRYRMNRYCLAHVRRLFYHGEPDGIRVRIRDYRSWLPLSDRLLKDNSGHPHARQAADWWVTWVNQARAGVDVPGKEFVSRGSLELWPTIAAHWLALTLLQSSGGYPRFVGPRNLVYEQLSALLRLLPHDPTELCRSPVRAPVWLRKAAFHIFDGSFRFLSGLANASLEGKPRNAAGAVDPRRNQGVK